MGRREELRELLNEIRSLRQYIGARYVPKFMGTYDVTTEYEALSVVDNGMGTSYICGIPTPPGTPLTDTDYWHLYGSSSGAIIDLQSQIDDMKDGDVEGSLQNQINDLGDDITELQNNIIYVNVKNLGAVGDGVTDDTEALQSAFDLSAEEGVRIFIPSGEYLVTSTLYVKPNTYIEGVRVPEQYGNVGPESVIKGVLTDRSQPVFNISNNMDNYQVGNIDRATAVTLKNIKIAGEFLQSCMCGIYMCASGTFIENVKIDGYDIGLILERSYRVHFKNLHIAGAYKALVTRYSMPLVTFEYCWFTFVGNTSYINNQCPASVLTLVRTFCPSANDYPTGITMHQCETMIMNNSAIEAEAYAVDAVSSTIFGDGNNFESISMALVKALKSGGSSRMIPCVKFTGLNIYNSESFPACHYSEQSYVSMVILETYGALPTNILDPIYTANGINQGCSISSPIDGNKFITPVITDKDDNILNIPVKVNHSYIDDKGYMNIDLMINDFANWPTSASNGVHIKFNESYYDQNVYHPIIGFLSNGDCKKFYAVCTSTGGGYKILAANASDYAVKSDLNNGNLEIKLSYRLCQT